ncbi:MAG: hypothetical protein IKS66_05695 [Oscillospiraceae bacterium]|nr:hypothetical protein [Oscillospiraceae bacterium]
MEFDALRRALEENADLRAAVGSPEAQRLMGRLDAAALEQAAQQGDPDQLKRLLARVLATPEGQRLARQVRDAVRRDG